MKSIGVIDYKAGNAPSVLNALIKLSVPAKLVKTPSEAEDVCKLILPGVGSARATMESLKESGWIEELNKRVVKEKLPFLGICVGLQILFEHSEEGDTDCLGFFEGKVVRFPESVRVPHIGWNRADFVLGGKDYFYFVNSYYVVPKDESIIFSRTDYGGIEFCSMIKSGNISAAQFHLEKSGTAGLKLLQDFAVRAGEKC